MKRFPKNEKHVVTWIKNGKEIYITRDENDRYAMYEDINGNFIKVKTSNDPKKLEKGFWD